MNSIDLKYKSKSLKPSLDDASSGGNSTQILTLSLFIVLLAFFIVLSASYSFDQDKVEDAMDSINAAFGQHIFSTALNSPSMQEDNLQESGDGFADQQDFRNFMQDSFQGFDLRISEEKGEKMIALLKLDKQEFHKHFKYISRKMATVYNRRNKNDVSFLLKEYVVEPLSRRQILNLSKLVIRTKQYGVPIGGVNIAFEDSSSTGFAIEFIFSERSR